MPTRWPTYASLQSRRLDRHPPQGFAGTHLNGFAGTQTVAENAEGAEVIIEARVADVLPGTFVSRTGLHSW